MNREALIALAQESELWEIITRYTRVFAGRNADPKDLIWSDLERFADLVAAREREVCAKECENLIVDREDSKDYDQACVDCAECIRLLGDEEDE